MYSCTKGSNIGSLPEGLVGIELGRRCWSSVAPVGQRLSRLVDAPLMPLGTIEFEGVILPRAPRAGAPDESELERLRAEVDAGNRCVSFDVTLSPGKRAGVNGVTRSYTSSP
jgi:hypothetical protein